MQQLTLRRSAAGHLGTIRPKPPPAQDVENATNCSHIVQVSGILIFRRHLRHRRLLRADLVACGLPAIPYFSVIWDLEDDPEGNFQHIAENGVTREEVEEILDLPGGVDRSRSSGRPIVFGETSAGRMIAVVFEEIDADSVYPITAYEVES